MLTQRRIPHLLLALAAGVTLALAGCAVPADDTTAPAAPGATGQAAPANDGPLQHAEDVVVDSCAIADEFTKWPKATLTITNQSSKASTYSVTVSFRSPDGATQYGEGFAAVARLEPGQKTAVDAQGLAEIPDGAAFECVVVSAQRTAAF